MPSKRRKRHPKKVPATIHFSHAPNEKDHQQLCVFAECSLSGDIIGPIWGHTDKAVRHAVETLTQKCDCPAKFHKVMAYEGKQIIKTARRDP